MKRAHGEQQAIDSFLLQPLPLYFTPIFQRERMESRGRRPSKTLRSHGPQSSRMICYLEELANNVQASHLEEASSSGKQHLGLVSVYSDRRRSDDASKRLKKETSDHALDERADSVQCGT